MAHPFGGHPQFGHVKTWARREGIEIIDCVTEDSVKVTIFKLPDGRQVPVAHTLDGDYLTPTVLGNLERRLGMKSGWFVLPS